jgi:hypothetical protein
MVKSQSCDFVDRCSIQLTTDCTLLVSIDSSIPSCLKRVSSSSSARRHVSSNQDIVGVIDNKEQEAIAVLSAFLGVSHMC